MLIIIYSITAVLMLAGFRTLMIASVFFALCYLPGLVLLAILKKESLKSEDLILAFPVSIGISSLLTLGLLSAGIHVKFIAYIILGFTGLSLLIYVVKYKKSLPLNINLSAGEVRFLTFALLLTLVFSIPVISERISISHHGFHHLSIVTRIFSGYFPPENPGMGGTAIGYQWGYHALVAAISYPANYHPLRIFSVLNIMSLFFILSLAYRSAKLFGFSECYSDLVPLTLIGLMRSDAGIFYLRNLIADSFPPVQNIASAPLNLLSSWVAGVSYLDTRLFFMNKFYNANNMPIGLCLIFAFFFILLLLSDDKKKNSRGNIYLICLSLILIGLAITYAFLLIIPLIFVPVWSVVLLFTDTGSYRERLWKSFKLIIPCLIAAVIVAPYIWLVASVGSVVTAGKSASEFKFIHLDEQVLRNLIVFLLPSPFIIAGCWYAFKRLAFSREFLFLMSGSAAFLLLSVFLRLNWSNSAKFSYILLFFFSFLFVFSMSNIFSLFSNIWLKRGTVACMVIFLSATPVITEAAYIFSPWFRDTTYTFRERQVVFAQDKSRNEAYTWIRDNTPADSLLVMPYLDTPYGITIAEIISYRPVALSERSLFVVKDVYAYLHPEYEGRVEIRKQLFENPGNIKVKKFLASINRPVYLLEEEGYEDPIMEGVELDRVPENTGEALLLIFQNDRQRVYKVN